MELMEEGKGISKNDEFVQLFKDLAFQAKHGTCAKFSPPSGTMAEKIFYLADVFGMEIPPEFRDEFGRPSVDKVKQFRRNAGLTETEN